MKIKNKKGGFERIGKTINTSHKEQQNNNKTLSAHQSILALWLYRTSVLYNHKTIITSYTRK